MVKGLTARSVVLSVLLGAHPASASAAELICLTKDFDLREATLRVALTRMVSAGDLVRSVDGYRLSDRLLTRQRRQDDALDPQALPWDGSWLAAVIVGVGADARSRSDLRNMLVQHRFGELREGVWLRPDNLKHRMPVTPRVRMLRVRDEDPSGLAAVLWDLPRWAGEGRRLIDEMVRARGIPERFVVAAGIVRHLVTDPVLPAELLPPDWPGAALRQTYGDFAAELGRRRVAGGAARR